MDIDDLPQAALWSIVVYHGLEALGGQATQTKRHQKRLLERCSQILDHLALTDIKNSAVLESLILFGVANAKKGPDGWKDFEPEKKIPFAIRCWESVYGGNTDDPGVREVSEGTFKTEIDLIVCLGRRRQRFLGMPWSYWIFTAVHSDVTGLQTDLRA
ncbi:hypothetical protein SISNIDRAFT_237354 [Sistotremastrum niveocremeum HHB9708]|uniref:Uncharacterized protein n=1 Tax=Sistotremastrum niveocremeum HHB9708 TaxID=1314777 RepID=A0A164PYU4_9AGAM|nr:hypothetical protein SISNIDRAFT_237354 [Sistotremastrum niveocremeum HHB9708]